LLKMAGFSRVGRSKRPLKPFWTPFWI